MTDSSYVLHLFQRIPVEMIYISQNPLNLSNGLAHNFEFGTIHLEIKGFEYHKMQN
jgi:hypothetical protein